MARLDRATQQPRVCAANEFYVRLGGPLLRAMTRRAENLPYSPSTTSKDSRALRWKTVILKNSVWDNFPSSFRSDENMPLQLHDSIIIQCSKRNPVDLAIHYSAQSRTAFAAELLSCSVLSDI